MAFGQNEKGPCGKKAKWPLGEMGTLGEMASGRNEKWSKMKLDKTAKGQGRYWAEWEKGELGKGEKSMGETGKNRAKWEWAKWVWANWEYTISTDVSLCNGCGSLEGPTTQRDLGSSDFLFTRDVLLYSWNFSDCLFARDQYLLQL